MHKLYAVLLLALFAQPVLAEDPVPPAPKNCRNPDGMARFTLECLKLSNDGLTACYQIAARIYCDSGANKASDTAAAPATPQKP